MSCDPRWGESSQGQSICHKCWPNKWPHYRSLKGSVNCCPVLLYDEAHPAQKRHDNQFSVLVVCLLLVWNFDGNVLCDKTHLHVPVPMFGSKVWIKYNDKFIEKLITDKIEFAMINMLNQYLQQVIIFTGYFPPD